MFAERVTFTRASCLVGIDAQETSTGDPCFIARMSVVEEAGAIVRPIVGQDGRRIKIVAASERLAMKVAVSYLEGPVRSPNPAPRALPRSARQRSACPLLPIDAV